ncbi:MAG: hypothetical protein FWG07_08600 [Treponema sp.]|nr:hypothetical protein [Treponema sp.]
MNRMVKHYSFGAVLHLLFLLLLPSFVVFSQESADSGSFGFGDTDSTSGNMPAVKISGEISAQLLAFTDELGSSDKRKGIEPGNVFSGKLNFTASGKTADGVINLKVEPDFSDDSFSSPVIIDEAYLRIYVGPVDIEAGLRKLTWGRADSFGPLDVINPVDYSDLSDIGNPRDIKLARPMLHVSWNMGTFSKLEGVFVPWFAGNKYAMEGRWAPPQIMGLPGQIQAGVINSLPGMVPPLFSAYLPTIIKDANEAFNKEPFDPADLYQKKTDTLKYAQGGLRFTTTIGESDLGVQYYFGRLSRPAYAIDLRDIAVLNLSLPFLEIHPEKIHYSIDYNYFHQIGVDYAQVIAGFNLRAETGINITSDLKGDDEAVYNPHFVWSLGFDRDLFLGINLNLQGNGLIRLMHDKIGSDPLVIDTENGKKITSTRITAILSKKIFQDELELKTTALWGIEDKDFFIVPAIIWSKNDITAELSVGIFGGDRTGELGQYRDNCYIKTVVGWSF